jgi:hypothetical protein
MVCWTIEGALNVMVHEEAARPLDAAAARLLQRDVRRDLTRGT